MTKTKELPDSADAIVIGGGVIGASIAYHLAKAGMNNTILLERKQLSAGTTWHSAGNMETYRSDPVIYEMVRYGVRLFPELEQESEQLLGWKTRGRIYYACNELRNKEYQAVPKLAAVRGIDVDYVDNRKIRELFPIIETSGILGGLWVPEDGSVNPTDLTNAFARAGKKRGVRVFEDTAVTAIHTEDGHVSGVEVGSHHIQCERVILAAGLWCNDIAATCGVSLPLYALQHFYMLTDSIPELPPALPMFLGFDDFLYGREEVGGLLIGCFDSNAMPVSTRELPEDFAFELLKEDWGHFEPYMLKAMERFPLLEDAGIKMLLNGPESFTPDGNMIIGPTADMEGLFVASGMSSCGIALSSSVGQIMADWIIKGRPELDVSRLDVRRFSKAQATEEFMRQRVTEIPSYIVSVHETGDDFATSRDVQLSPLHEYLAKLGGHFVSRCGWERALWVVSGEPERPWRVYVNEETRQLESAVLLIDRSTDVIVQVEGAGSSLMIQSCLGKTAVPGVDEVSNCAIIDDDKYVHVIVTVQRVSQDKFLLSCTVEQESYLQGVLIKKMRYMQDCQLENVSSHYACIRVVGPLRHKYFEKWFDSEVFASPPRAERIVVQVGSVSAVFWEDPWSESSYILCAADDANDLASALYHETSGVSIRWGGFLAEEAFRISSGLPALGPEVSSISNVCLQDFKCLSEEKYIIENPAYRVIHGSVAMEMGASAEFEPVFYEDNPVGWVTSSAWVESGGRSIVMLRVRSGFHDKSLTILANNEFIPLTRSS